MKQKKWKILVLEQGLREKNLKLILKKSRILGKLYSIPSEPQDDHYQETRHITLQNHPQIMQFIKQNNIDIVFPGSGRVFASGLVELLEKNNITIFPPRALSNSLSYSRIAWREILQNYSLPVPNSYIFKNIDGVDTYLEKAQFPLVAKTDGTYLSKTSICYTSEQMEAFLTSSMKEKMYGEEGAKIIIEKGLQGPVFTIPVIMEGYNMMIMPICRHIHSLKETLPFKSAYTSDSVLDKKTRRNIEGVIVVPLVHALNRQLPGYQGILSIDVVISKKITYIVDVKMQWNHLVSPFMFNSLKSDYLQLIVALLQGNLGDFQPEWKSQKSLHLIFSMNNLEVSQHARTFMNENQEGYYYGEKNCFYSMFPACSRLDKHKKYSVVSIMIGGKKLSEGYELLKNHWQKANLPQNAFILNNVTTALDIVQRFEKY